MSPHYIPAPWLDPDHAFWTTELILDDARERTIGLQVAISTAFYAQPPAKRMDMIESLRDAFGRFLETIERS